MSGTGQDNGDSSLFSVASQFDVLLDPIPTDALWLDEDALIQAMPSAFQIMVQVADLEGRCLPLLKGLEQHARTLADYLALQSQKIDLVLQHQLAQDPDATYRSTGLSFGGSGLTIDRELPPGQALAIRLFLTREHVAVFAHGEVQDCQDGRSQIAFTAIREADQDRLVRASLAVQQSQLRQRAEARRRNR